MIKIDFYKIKIYCSLFKYLSFIKKINTFHIKEVFENEKMFIESISYFSSYIIDKAGRSKVTYSYPREEDQFNEETHAQTMCHLGK